MTLVVSGIVGLVLRRFSTDKPVDSFLRISSMCNYHVKFSSIKPPKFIAR